MLDDPFASVETIDPGSFKEPTPLSQFDPFGSVAITGADKKEELPFMQKPESFTATVLDTIPFGKYMLPEEQEKFSYLSEEEQSHALAWGALGLALFPLGGPLLRGAGRVASSVTQRVGRGLFPKMGVGVAQRLEKTAAMPVEDLLAGISAESKMYKYKPFNAEEATINKLKGSGFKPEEAEAIAKAQRTQDPRAYTDAILERKFQGKEMSKKWRESVAPTNTPYGGFELSDDVAKEISVDTLQSKHYAKQYEKVFANEVLHTKNYPKDFFERTYQRQMAAKYPEKAGEAFKLADITERDFADFMTDMLGNRVEYRSAMSIAAGKRWWPAALTPSRVIYGLNEENWGAYSKIYEPLREGMEASRRYTFDRTLAWMDQLKQRGLGDIKFDKYGAFKLQPNFTAEESDAAYKILRKVDDLAGQKGKDRTIIDGEINQLFTDLNPSDKVREIINSWRDFSDTLYGEALQDSIGKALRGGGKLSVFGQNSVDALMAKYIPKITGTFSSSGSRPATQKILEARQYLDEIKGLLTPSKEGTHPWFELEGNDLKKHLDGLARNLTLRNDKGNLIGYTDHYTARISSDQERFFEKWSQALVGKRGFYEKARKSEFMLGEPVDFKTMIESRIHAQANAMHLYPTLDKVVAKAKDYPTNLAAYVEHHIARILNMPSSVDAKLATWFEGSIGKVESLFGGSGEWSPRRVMNLGQTVNDLVYLGALGFKPFSAARNLFQPLITVPADLGGLKDYGTLAKAYTRLIGEEGVKTRKYLNEIGLISEYAPDVSIRPKALPFSKTNMFGKEFDTSKVDSFKDAAMWMFKASDRFNRYVTGAAALTKWEGAMKQFSQGITKDNIAQALKATGVSTRNPWVKTEIEDMMRRGMLDEAKSAFIKDVVADTQFLYGSLDAPGIIGRGGAIGKTGLTFQSYWMNLAPLIEKSFRTGEIEDRIRRPLMGMLSSAIAYELMAPIYGKKPAMESIGAGPFPTTLNEYMIPAAWSPIYRSLKTIASGLELNPDATAKEAKNLMKSTLIFVPGGLQAKKMFKGSMEEGFQGFAKSIVGMPKASEKTAGVVASQLFD